jgi:ankyrin repeat protein
VTIQLTSNSSSRLAFKMKTTSPKKYSVSPSSGIIEPNAVREVKIILQSQREPPASYPDCRDKFLVQCMKIKSFFQDIDDMFAGAKHEAISMTKIKVCMIPPTKHASKTLFQAIEEVNLEHVEILLSHGVNADSIEEDGVTALMAAANLKEGRVDCLNLLLKYGANVNASTNEMVTALMIAVALGHTNCVDLLLKHGADVNDAAEGGITTTMIAAGGGYINCLEVLMEHGANIYATNDDGETALTLAATEGHVDCVDLLLKHGANFDDDKIKEALDIVAKKHDACAKLLQGHMYRSERESLDSDQARRQMETLVLDSAAATIPSPSAPFMTVAPIPTPDARKDVSHQNWVISVEELQLGKMIGKGSYAEVYSAKWHGTEVAAKLFTLPGGSTDSQAEFSTALLNKITDEADLLAAIRHPNVVAFLAMCPDPPCMVTEMCSGGSLFDVIKRCKNDPDFAAKLTWGRRLSMLIDAAAGISHLHQRKPPILHRDLKSLNMLVDLGWKVKIADLGLSKLLEEVTTQTHAGSTASSMNPRWTAPEVFETGNWLPAGDVYSFGVVMWELLTWELPWSHVNQYQVSHKLPYIRYLL